MGKVDITVDLSGDIYAIAFNKGYDHYPSYQNPYESGTREYREYKSGFGVAHHQSIEKWYNEGKITVEEFEVMSVSTMA